MNNKYEVLICTGRLEVQLKGHETLLKELKDLQKAIIEDDYANCVIIFGKFSELVKKTITDDDVMADLDYIGTYTSNEVLNSGIKDWKVLLEKSIEDLNLLLYVPVKALNLSTRAYNCLIRAGIYTISDIIEIPESNFVNYTNADGCKIVNMGRGVYSEVMDKMGTLGLKLKD